MANSCQLVNSFQIIDLGSERFDDLFASRTPRDKFAVDPHHLLLVADLEGGEAGVTHLVEIVDVFSPEGHKVNFYPPTIPFAVRIFLLPHQDVPLPVVSD